MQNFVAGMILLCKPHAGHRYIETDKKSLQLLNLGHHSMNHDNILKSLLFWY